jgi:hypothetical protein
MGRVPLAAVVMQPSDGTTHWVDRVQVIIICNDCTMGRATLAQLSSWDGTTHWVADMSLSLHWEATLLSASRLLGLGPPQ